MPLAPPVTSATLPSTRPAMRLPPRRSADAGPGEGARRLRPDDPPAPGVNRPAHPNRRGERSKARSADRRAPVRRLVGRAATRTAAAGSAAAGLALMGLGPVMAAMPLVGP